MRQRLTVIILGVLGAVLIALGITSATVWRPDDVLVATTTGAAGTTLLVTDPGVLSLAGHPVTVTVSVPGSGTVVVALGRDTDVNGWVGSSPVTRVTGLSSWHVLETGTAAPTTATASAPAPSSSSSPVASPPATAPAVATGATGATATATATAPDPTGSDMWVVQATGAGRATLTWPEEPGRWILLVAATGADAAAPTLQLAWPQTVRTPWLVPGVVAGSVLVLVALWLLLRGVMRSRGGLAVTWNAIETGELVTVGAADSDVAGGGHGAGAPADAESAGGDGASLTRRQLRERERTAPVPIVVPKLSLRRRESEALADESPVADREGASLGEPLVAERDAAPAGEPQVAGRDKVAERSWEPIAATPILDLEDVAPRSSATNGVARADDVGALPEGSPHPDRPAGRRWRRDRRAVPPPSTDAVQAAPGPSTPSELPTPSDLATPPHPPTPSDPARADRLGDADHDADAPDADVPVVREAPSTGAGARADAWRRAWGFPGVEGADSGHSSEPPEPEAEQTTDDAGKV